VHYEKNPIADRILIFAQRGKHSRRSRIAKLFPFGWQIFVPLKTICKWLKILTILLTAVPNFKMDRQIDFACSDFKKFIADKPVLKVAYFIWKPLYGSWFWDFYWWIITIKSLENIYADRERYSLKLILQKYVLRVIPNLFFSRSSRFHRGACFEIGIHTHHGKTIFFVMAKCFHGMEADYQSFGLFQKSIIQ
jgi:hypothetical protein